ncbi:hypothetical protein E8E13_007550 [Curvularia kusanoi]|uniref:Uncharacterized protein n=1 Tax=Curvularia kusanoi TaxID=90978 RepID=A0A9P4TEB3_CURKU|nr:hypothetical protein E8E13_007550 [Curvularia kusanoi]
MLLNQIAVLLTALAASTSAQGFTVPEGTTDGDYSVSYDASGNASFLKLRDVEPLTKRQEGLIAMPRRHLAARTDRIGCGDRNNELNHSDTDKANDSLDAKCNGDRGAYVPAGTDFFAKHGSTVAFFCNWGGGNGCDAGTRRRTSGQITNQCGWYKAGWVEGVENKISYGYDWATARFCGRDHSGTEYPGKM